MDKQLIIEAIRENVTKEITNLKEVVKATIEGVTNEESKPENEYDTRGLEATYLARGQNQRIADLEEVLLMLRHINLKNFGPNDGISNTALVEIEFNGKKSTVFMLAKGGGIVVKVQGQTIQVVTPSSPLGEALLDQKEGGSAGIESGNDYKEYDILSVK